MKKRILLYTLVIFFSIRPFTGQAQAVNTQDSLALVDLYNSTSGPGWINHTNWLTPAPVSTWFGVTVVSGRVSWLQLFNNKLAGFIPPSFGNITQVGILDLHQNQLTGNIPSSIGNLPGVFALDLSNNQFSGIVPSSLANLPAYTFLSIDHNNYTFDGLEFLVNSMLTKSLFLTCNPEGDIPVHKNGNIYSVSAGGTLSKNTYKWYKDDVLVATKTGDSTYTTSVPGNYSVEVSNAIVTTNPILNGVDFQVTLYSTSTANLQDSLAVVDLYNSTNGPGWINNHNWLSTAPLATWYGLQ